METVVLAQVAAIGFVASFLGNFIARGITSYAITRTAYVTGTIGLCRGLNS